MIDDEFQCKQLFEYPIFGSQLAKDAFNFLIRKKDRRKYLINGRNFSHIIQANDEESYFIESFLNSPKWWMKRGDIFLCQKAGGPNLHKYLRDLMNRR